MPLGSREAEAHELLFTLFAEVGYRWEEARLVISPSPSARTVPAVDADGAAISDHDLVVAGFS
jgi:hypothetical protein